MKTPKVKKGLSGFLTSGSKDILIKGLVSGSIIASGVGNTYGGYITSIDPEATFYPTDSEAYNAWPGAAQKEFTLINSATCSHASGIVNGHFSAVPGVSLLSEKYTISKTYYHENHSSGGWCP